MGFEPGSATCQPRGFRQVPSRFGAGFLIHEKVVNNSCFTESVYRTENNVCNPSLCGGHAVNSSCCRVSALRAECEHRLMCAGLEQNTRRVGGSGSAWCGARLCVAGALSACEARTSPWVTWSAFSILRRGLQTSTGGNLRGAASGLSGNVGAQRNFVLDAFTCHQQGT